MAFGSIVEGQGSQVAKANALFSDLAHAATYSQDVANCSGLAIALFDGWINIAGVRTAISAYTATLTASATNYIEAHPDTGAVTRNTSAFTPGYIPLHKVVTGTATVTTWEDQRILPLPTNATLAKALSDANTTLTQPEAANSTLTFTGTLTATRDIVVPLVGKKQWTVYNGTGQSLRFIGASGTGITVATVKHATVRSDGTNIVRVTADT